MLCTGSSVIVHVVASDGGEAGSPSVPDGTCMACPEASMYTGVICDAERFTDDGDAGDGCEAGCPSFADGSAKRAPTYPRARQ